jgi:hypothetical protein
VRVNQYRETFLKASEGIRVAVNQEQRHTPAVLRSLVNEVKAEALHLRATVPEAVQGALLVAPVELGLPVAAEFLQVVGVRPVVSAAVAHGGWPSGPFEAAFQILDFLVGNGDREGFDVHHAKRSVSAQVCTEAHACAHPGALSAIR